GNILDADQHAGDDGDLFFMRLVWNLEGFALDRAGVAAGIGDLARRFDLAWELTYSDETPRVVVFATKAPHCLYDLLLSQQLGELGGQIVHLISNHETLKTVCDHFAVPFCHVPVAPHDKPNAEARQQSLLEDAKTDLVVLARYMQILSKELVLRWPGKIINIHHSFLPAFVGAKPYHQ